MEKDLQQISVKEGFVPFEKFHKFLEKVKTHNNIINLLIDYLKKYTQKDYCIPDDIINIFKNLDYSLSLDDKKIFLFKMILTIYGQENLNYAQINKYLNINYEKNNAIVNDNSGLYDEKGFLNNDKFKEMINKLNPYLESFGLIPYKYLKVKVNDKEKIKIIINNFLKNESDGKLEKYLEKNFNECSSFYAIDVKFWNSLINKNDVAPDYINNSRIAEEINIVTEEEKIKKEIEEQREKEKDKKNIKNADNIKEKYVNDNNENIEAKPAKLKKGLKYKNDFIVVCGQLYEILNTNYKQDYIIKFTKLQTEIDLNKDNNNEEKKENDENEKKNNEKGEIKEDKKDDKKENQEKKEDYINKEKMFKENLDKFILDENKGLISKIVISKENKWVLYELDFYPVQIYLSSFETMVRDIEKAKICYEKLNEEKKLIQLSKKEKKKVDKEKKKKDELNKKILEYNQKKEEYEQKKIRNEIPQNKYKKKIDKLNKHYKDILDILQKENNNNYEVEITMDEFKNTLVKYKNNLIKEKYDKISLYSRYKTFKEIKDNILKRTPGLREKKFDFYYFIFSSQQLLNL